MLVLMLLQQSVSTGPKQNDKGTMLAGDTMMSTHGRQQIPNKERSVGWGCVGASPTFLRDGGRAQYRPVPVQLPRFTVDSVSANAVEAKERQKRMGRKRRMEQWEWDRSAVHEH